jgi:hypothetical protein
MTFRQQVRIRFAVLKKAIQLRRCLTETETRETLAEVLQEKNILFGLVGALTVTWAEVELVLDFINGLLTMYKTVKDRELPRSLRPKIAFFKKNLYQVPELTALQERTARIVAELNRLKVIRHDIVHGVAVGRMPVNVSRVLRLEYEGKDIKFRYTTYEFADIVSAMNDARALRDELNSIFWDMVRIKLPDAAKQIFG